MPENFNELRGTRLGESGADAFTIMRVMGHSTVTVSQKYVHPSPEALADSPRIFGSKSRSKRE
jgi:site-specific recombinase XerD